ncbi:hypothetical protein [Pontibacter pamirensis]|uniref:hypothetical protein n=1 Tax=Pontibacter pamirensis TaxID=2562824 RepID=UPI00138A386E|nr:hypothetical protein [Pontibacter pamirensis]
MKKLSTHDLHPSLPKVRNVDSSIASAALLNIVLCMFSCAHILAGIMLSFLNTDLYYTYLKEDGYIEYFTAVFLIILSAFCFYKALFSGRKLPMLFFYAAAFIFFLGFGEEISWGQRIFGFATPDDLEKINAQKEFNLHNIHLNGVNLNKVIFGKVLYTFVFIYFLGFPLLYRRKNWFRQLVDKIDLPIPTTTQSLIYFLSFFSILLIREGEKWELQEFALASFVFFSFLLPSNTWLNRNTAYSAEA